MSAITTPSSNGITAQAAKLKPKVSSGARINSILLDEKGIIISLCKSFMASAIGCNRPNAPTMFGPIRSCIAPIIFLSAYVI